jgi:DNA topoisomerase-1
MHDEHVDIHGATLHFEFRGKSGKDHVVEMKDRRLAKIVKNAQDVPGQDLFQYTDHEGHAHRITSADVNAYIQDAGGESFTAKDFRTWGGTILAIQALAGLEPFANETAARKNLVTMYKSVAEQLGNTVAVCRKYYVYPLIAELYRSGKLAEYVTSNERDSDDDAHSLQQWEQALIAILSRENDAKSAKS